MWGINFCRSPPNIKIGVWGDFQGELIFFLSMNSSLNKIFQGEIIFMVPPEQIFMFSWEKLIFVPPPNKIFGCLPFRGKTITLSHQIRGYLGPAEICIIAARLRYST